VTSRLGTGKPLTFFYSVYCTFTVQCSQANSEKPLTGLHLLYALSPKESIPPAYVTRAHICKRLWSPEIDSDGPIPPAYVAWRAGTKNRVVVQASHAGNRFLGSLKGLQIRALAGRYNKYCYRTGPPGYRGWRNRFLGSLNVYTYSGSEPVGRFARFGTNQGCESRRQTFSSISRPRFREI
jgi:hypothetical protein